MSAKTYSCDSIATLVSINPNQLITDKGLSHTGHVAVIELESFSQLFGREFQNIHGFLIHNIDYLSADEVKSLRKYIGHKIIASVTKTVIENQGLMVIELDKNYNIRTCLNVLEKV